MADSAKVRAQLRLEATTSLSPSDALSVVRGTTAQIKGGPVNVLTTGLMNVGAQVNVERASPDRLALSITSGKRIFELSTFSARVAGPAADGKTRLTVGGLERYKTTQTTMFMIPIGPKKIASYDLYQRFLDAVASALRERDPAAAISVKMPS